MAPSYRRRATESTPDAIAFEPTGRWEGNDGSWSTFLVRIGAPQQNFRVIPSTATSEVWVPSGQSDGFQINESSTWRKVGDYELELEEDLGYYGNAAFGYDRVALNGTDLSLENQTIAVVSSDDYSTGIFGLDGRVTNATAPTDGRTSFMKNLKDQNLIPSLSYAYTAGASYENNVTAAGSLTLGGYDQSRFEASGFNIPFSDDETKPLTLGVQSFLGQNTFEGSASFYTTGYWSVIDSTVPHIWLPSKACDLMERTLKLTYDNSTDLYLVNASIRDQLLSLNPVFTFTIGSWIYGGNTTEIKFPYSAFDKQVSQPYYTNSTYYFPIRKAQNDSQLVLGRTFLQQAYLIVDYEEETFSVNAANFSDPMPAQDIIPIVHANTGVSGSTSSGGETDGVELSTGAIAGIGVGAAVVAIAFLVMLVVCCRRRRSKTLEETPPLPVVMPNAPELSDEGSRFEAPGHRYEYSSEIDGTPVLQELYGTNVEEKKRWFNFGSTGQPILHELPENTQHQPEQNQHAIR